MNNDNEESKLCLIYFLRQVALADLTIVNKTDLVSEEQLNQVRDTVRSTAAS